MVRLTRLLDSSVNPIRLAEALPVLTLGIVGGISFFAQVVKFLTPELTLVQLVEVGATIFRKEHLLQVLLIALMCWAVPRAKERSSTAWALLCAISVILLTQAAWIMPVLDTQLVRMKQNLDPGSPMVHVVYVALEALKLSLLTTLALLQRKTSMPSPRGSVEGGVHAALEP